MGQKGYSLLLILVGVVIATALLGGGYIHLQNSKKVPTGESANETVVSNPIPASSPSPSVTALTNNWKNYTDSENGFSFSYPSDWNIVQNTPGNLIIANFEATGSSGALDPIKDQGKGSVNFLITQSESSQTLKGYVEKKIKDLEDYEGKKDYILQNSIVGGKPAVTAIKTFNFGDLESSDKVYIEYSPLKYLIVEPKIHFPSYKDDFNKIIQTVTFGKFSPSGKYIITEETVGDGQTILLKDSSGNIISKNIIEDNSTDIGYNLKFRCQCGTSFKEWTDDDHFTIKIVNGGGEEFEYMVDAATGKVDPVSFKKIK